MPAHSIQLKTIVDAVSHILETHGAEVDALDQEIGDGDHLFNLKRGIAALVPLMDELDIQEWSSVFQKIGMTLMSTVGGASGSLYGTLFLTMAKVFKEKGEMNLPNLAAAFSQGVDSMRLRGKAEPGEKTMLDVLVPVANALTLGASGATGQQELRERISRVAADGCEATRDLIATKGRASFLGERARGTLDPGARSAQLMIDAIMSALPV